MTHPSWVALHGMADGFIQWHKPLQHKAVIHERGLYAIVSTFRMWRMSSKKGTPLTFICTLESSKRFNNRCYKHSKRIGNKMQKRPWMTEALWQKGNYRNTFTVMHKGLARFLLVFSQQQVPRLAHGRHVATAAVPVSTADDHPGSHTHSWGPAGAHSHIRSQPPASARTVSAAGAGLAQAPGADFISKFLNLWGWLLQSPERNCVPSLTTLLSSGGKPWWTGRISSYFHPEVVTTNYHSFLENKHLSA